jgi:hypothetical protein
MQIARSSVRSLAGLTYDMVKNEASYPVFQIFAIFVCASFWFSFMSAVAIHNIPMSHMARLVVSVNTFVIRIIYLLVVSYVVLGGGEVYPDQCTMRYTAPFGIDIVVLAIQTFHYPMFGPNRPTTTLYYRTMARMCIWFMIARRPMKWGLVGIWYIGGMVHLTADTGLILEHMAVVRACGGFMSFWRGIHTPITTVMVGDIYDTVQVSMKWWKQLILIPSLLCICFNNWGSIPSIDIFVVLVCRLMLVDPLLTEGITQHMIRRDRSEVVPSRPLMVERTRWLDLPGMDMVSLSLDLQLSWVVDALISTKRFTKHQYRMDRSGYRQQLCIIAQDRILGNMTNAVVEMGVYLWWVHGQQLHIDHPPSILCTEWVILLTNIPCQNTLRLISLYIELRQQIGNKLLAHRMMPDDDSLPPPYDSWGLKEPLVVNR